MKPRTITDQTMSTPGRAKAIHDWLEANGVRHYIPEHARIIVTGNWIIVPTFDIGRIYNPRYGWNRKDGTLKVKTRRYRIRHELKLEQGVTK